MDALARVRIPAVVGVIASAAELRAASRMRAPPDLFELRLDHLPALRPSEISELRRPLIITARHPAEGGRQIPVDRCRTGAPPAQRRRDVLLKFLPCAQFVDVELRSLRELRGVWEEARRSGIGRICSLHDFGRTPSHAFLQKQVQRAKKSGADIFKVVTRADTPDDLLTLLQFLRRAPQPCSVMATGKFGPISRLLFPECGSVFVYAPLRQTLHPGQLTLPQWRRLRDFYATNQGRTRNLIGT